MIIRVCIKTRICADASTPLSMYPQHAATKPNLNASDSLSRLHTTDSAVPRLLYPFAKITLQQDKDVAPTNKITLQQSKFPQRSSNSSFRQSNATLYKSKVIQHLGKLQLYHTQTPNRSEVSLNHENQPSDYSRKVTQNIHNTDSHHTDSTPFINAFQRSHINSVQNKQRLYFLKNRTATTATLHHNTLQNTFTTNVRNFLFPSLKTLRHSYNGTTRTKEGISTYSFLYLHYHYY